MNSISERLLLVRGKTKQKAFADALGINANTLRGYENGRVQPNHELLEKICVQFSVNPEWLLLGTGPMKGNDEATTVAEEPATVTRGVQGVWTSTGLEVKVKLLEEKLAEAIAAKDKAMQEALNAYKMALEATRAESEKAKDATTSNESRDKGGSKNTA